MDKTQLSQHGGKCYQNTGQGWWTESDICCTLRDASAGGHPTRI